LDDHLLSVVICIQEFIPFGSRTMPRDNITLCARYS